MIHFLPHGSGPEEAVLHAVRHAPFPNPTWLRPRAFVPGFPHFQLLLLRSPVPVTVILDQRPLEGDVLVVEANPASFTGEQFASYAPIAERSPIVAQVVRASQLVMYHNHRPWALAYHLLYLPIRFFPSSRPPWPPLDSLSKRLCGRKHTAHCSQGRPCRTRQWGRHGPRAPSPTGTFPSAPRASPGDPAPEQSLFGCFCSTALF